jgi:alpha-tubulin suppressor-like RCC1 family protein
MVCGCTSPAAPSLPPDASGGGSAEPGATASAPVASASAGPATPPPPLFGKAGQVELGGANLCVRASGGTVQCVGEWPLQHETPTSSGSRNQYIKSPLAVGGLATAKQIAVTTNRGCAVLDDGTVACWGNTVASRNGWSGALPGVLDAVPVAGLAQVEQIALAWNGSCALVRGGTVQCWGPELFNTSRQTGPADPPRTIAVKNVRQIAAARTHVCALLESGTVSCWGEDRRDSRRVTPISGLAGIAQIAVGSYHACARTTAGEVLCWSEGTAPAQVAGIVGATQVATADSSRFSCALLANHDVVCWGENINCSLGDVRPVPCEKRTLESTFGPSDTEICSAPQRITMPIMPTRISLGSSTACAENAAGEAACWGRDLMGGGNRCSAQALR